MPGLEDAGTTWCPNCKKAVVERDIFAVARMDLMDGKCRFCGTKIAGLWKA
jgi:pyruvate formate lyase activating enzyme